MLGIDLVFIGSQFRTAVAHVLAACQKRGLPYGTLSPNIDGVKARLAEGFTFLSMGTDILHLLGSLNTQ